MLSTVSAAWRRGACARSPCLVRLLSAESTPAAGMEVKDKLVIFDTTLRDGEQSPGATLSFNEKLTIARHLSGMGIDVCEAGFPIASPGDFDAVTAIATSIGPLLEGREATGEPMVIAGLARANTADIERCYEAVRHAPRHRIHTFIATSDLHLEHKLKISRDECIEQAATAVRLASSLCDDVEFSPEDAGRSDPEFLVQVLREVVAAGATTLNIPDTVGYTIPGEYGGLISELIDGVFGGPEALRASGVVFSTHCHNDLGLATANALSAVQAGARQVEVAVNGIGERAGNTSLEEVVMALRTRPTLFPVVTSVDTSGIMRASALVSRFTGMVVQPNKAIVGKNAFAHEAGIHQDGVLKHRGTYEIMEPESVGLNKNALVLGKHSGRAAYRDRLETLGYALHEEDLSEVVEKCKIVADSKKIVTDDDIEAIVADVLYKPGSATWTLTSLHVTAGNMVQPTATVSIRRNEDGREVSHASVGTGPIDAVYQCIAQATGVRCRLQDFQIQSIREGATKALGVVTVKVTPGTPSDKGRHNQQNARPTGAPGAPQGLPTKTVDGPAVVAEHAKISPQTGRVVKREYAGRGTSTDIITASATAYVNALNRMLAAEAGKDDSFLVGSLGGGELLTRSSVDDAVSWSDASRLN